MDPNYPTTKPEDAILITEPMSALAIDLKTGIVTLTFAEGETAEVNLADSGKLALGAWGFLNVLATHLADGQKVWASPEVIERDLKAAGVDTSERAPF